MSKNEINKTEMTTKGTDYKRRTLVKVALSVPPVIATLTSRPVQAVQGLSNMLSGDASVCRGDDRFGGQSPGFWKTPNGATDDNTPHRPAWELTEFWYSDQYENLPPGFRFQNSQFKNWDDHTGGTFFNAAFSASGINYSIANDMPLREVLGNYPSSPEFHYIAALLNIKYLESVGNKYFMTLAEFNGLLNGTIDLPRGYTSIVDLIHAHEHQVPGSSCDNGDFI